MAERQERSLAEGDGQPRHGAAKVATADEADRRHTLANPAPRSAFRNAAEAAG
jgi:hypothetical protein